MKILIIIIAILSGWLYTELKEFILQGGLENKLAIIILKILFICFFIFILAVVDVDFNHYFTQSGELNSPSTSSTPSTTDDRKNEQGRSVSKRACSKVRKNRFMDLHSD